MNDITLPEPKQSGDWEIGWELRAFNGGVRRRRLELGLTQRQLGRIVGVSNIYIGQVETMRKRPSDGVRARLANFFGCDEQEVWPDWLEPREQSLRASLYHKVDAVQFSALEGKLRRDLQALPAPEDPAADVEREISREELSQAVAGAMKALSPRERQVLSLRYGVGEANGKVHTLRECAEIMKVSAPRVRQIEERALSKLHERDKRRTLDKAAAEMLDMDRCPTCGGASAKATRCRRCDKDICRWCSASQYDEETNSYPKYCKPCADRVRTENTRRLNAAARQPDTLPPSAPEPAAPVHRGWTGSGGTGCCNSVPPWLR